MDEFELFDLGAENDKKLGLLRRALTLGSGFQLILLEVSHRSLQVEVVRRLEAWSGKDGVPVLDRLVPQPWPILTTRLRVSRGGYMLLGDSRSGETEISSRTLIDALHWNRDELPTLLDGPLILVLDIDQLREMFASGPDLFTVRAHSTHISMPPPVDLEVRPWVSRQNLDERRAWLEAMVRQAGVGTHLQRSLPNWYVRLAEIDLREGRDPEPNIAQAIDVARGRPDMLFAAELVRIRRCIDEGKYAEAEMHEQRAADFIAGTPDVGTWIAPRQVAGRSVAHWVSHDLLYGELRSLRAERLLSLGEYQQASLVAQSALQSAYRAGDQALQMNTLGVVAAIALFAGERNEARVRYDELRTIARSARDKTAELFALLHIAELSTERESRSKLHSEAISLAGHDVEGRARVFLQLAADALYAKDTQGAERLLANMQEEVLPRTHARRLILEGAVATALGQHAKAMHAYIEARNYLSRDAVTSRIARLDVLAGNAALRAGDLDEARASLTRGLDAAVIVADTAVEDAARSALRIAESEMQTLTQGSIAPHEDLAAETETDNDTDVVSMALSLSRRVHRAQATVPKNAVIGKPHAPVELEERYLSLVGDADTPQRLSVLDALASEYAKDRRFDDAVLSIVRAIWESKDDERVRRIEVWVSLALQAAGISDSDDLVARVDAILQSRSPSLEQVRLVAALAASRSLRDPGNAAKWLDDYDSVLDSRSLWLARIGVESRVSRGDDLNYARQRLLQRIAQGLDPQKELPTFLRASQPRSSVANSARVAAALERMASTLNEIRRKRSPVEASLQYTKSYMAFMFGYGFAKIGIPEMAHSFVSAAQHGLEAVQSDAVHGYLTEAFASRIAQVLGDVEGRPLQALFLRLSKLNRVEKYKVDRLREASQILEPIERPDAISAFSKRQFDWRGREFTTLAHLHEYEARRAEIFKLAEQATQEPLEADRMVVGVLDVALELRVEDAVEVLGRLLPFVRGASGARLVMLYGKTLVLAGHHSRMDTVAEVMQMLPQALTAASTHQLEEVLADVLPALWRIGLKDEIADLLQAAQEVVSRSNSSERVRTRLVFATGLAYLGQFDRARSTFDSIASLLRERMTLTARLDVTRALARAYAHAPLDEAMHGIWNMVPHYRDITDSFGTNSHYCISVLHFVESLVIGLASNENLRGGAVDRSWNDDEHLVRRRLR